MPRSTEHPAGHAPLPDWRRRAARLVLIAGIAIAAIPILDSTSGEREVVVRLAEPTGVEALEIRWLDGGEVVWSAVAGGSEMRRTLRLSPGRYQLEARVTRGGQTRELVREIEVVEGSDRVVVALRE